MQPLEKVALGLMLLLAVLFVVCDCNRPAEPDPCDDWTWIDDEGCLGDVCAEDPEATDYECRDGECWCCNEHECWPSY